MPFIKRQWNDPALSAIDKYLKLREAAMPKKKKRKKKEELNTPVPQKKVVHSSKKGTTPRTATRQPFMRDEYLNPNTRW